MYGSWRDDDEYRLNDKTCDQQRVIHGLRMFTQVNSLNTRLTFEAAQSRRQCLRLWFEDRVAQTSSGMKHQVRLHREDPQPMEVIPAVDHRLPTDDQR